MKATNLEFRFRMPIIFALYVLGFWAPWERYSSHTSAITSTWLELIGAIASAHWLSLSNATMFVTSMAIALAFAGAVIRIWGTAYLGASTMQAPSLQGQQVLAAGPYRHVRNPLYLGSYLTALTVAILMPPQGALFFVVTLGFFILRLVLAEESFLRDKLNGPYLDYVKRVPRILPSPWPRVPSSATRPHWFDGLLAETFPLAFAICFAVLAWRYNSHLLTQSVIICFGGSLIVRAMLPGRHSDGVLSK